MFTDIVRKPAATQGALKYVERKQKRSARESPVFERSAPRFVEEQGVVWMNGGRLR